MVDFSVPHKDGSRRADMPQRPRQHELDAEARRVFERALPPSWVTRPVSEEYGIDLEVEVFEDGQATGLMFKVQNKGTDAQANKKVPPAKVKSRTLAYWAALDSPVLIVRYLASSGDLYVRWAHGYSPSLRTRANDAKSREVPFSASHKADSQLGEKLLAELMTIRHLRSQAVSGPIPIQIISDEETHGRSKAEIRTALRTVFDHSGRHVRLAREDDEQCATLEISSKKIRFTMPVSLASVTLHVKSKEYRTPECYNDLYPDILIAVGFAFAKLGLSRQAAAFYNSASQSSKLICRPESAEVFAACYLELDQPGMAMRAAVPLMVSEDASARAYGRGFADELLFRRLPQLGSDETELLLRCLKVMADLELRQLGTSEASRTWYLIGQVCGASARWQELIDAYNRALDYDPTYWERPYFHHERGGALFHLCRYEDAAESYRLIIDDERVPDGRFLLADTLMHAGQYQEALKAATGGHDREGPYAGRLALYGVALRRVIEFAGVTEQQRQPLETLPIEEKDVSATDLARLLADHDALDPRLWMMVAAIAEEPLEKSFSSATVAAIMMLHDAKLWLVACQIGLQTEKDQALIDACVDSAFRLCEDDLPVALDELCAVLSDKDARELRTVVFRRGENRPSWPGQVFRLVRDDGSYEEFDVDL